MNNAESDAVNKNLTQEKPVKKKRDQHEVSKPFTVAPIVLS